MRTAPVAYAGQEIHGAFRIAETQVAEQRDVLFVGQAEVRGERGLMKISSDWLLRLRYKPFYSVLETRVLDWLDTTEPAL